LRFFAARRSARFALRPCEGGTEELSGDFGGCPSRASGSATRCVNASICAACARINAIRSSRGSGSSASRIIQS
jgi:hypothetical protein